MEKRKGASDRITRQRWDQRQAWSQWWEALDHVSAQSLNTILKGCTLKGAVKSGLIAGGKSDNDEYRYILTSVMIYGSINAGGCSAAEAFSF